PSTECAFGRGGSGGVNTTRLRGLILGLARSAARFTRGGARLAPGALGRGVNRDRVYAKNAGARRRAADRTGRVADGAADLAGQTTTAANELRRSGSNGEHRRQSCRSDQEFRVHHGLLKVRLA